MKQGDIIERKYLAHFIDEAFDITYASTQYKRMGEDLEEYNIDMNPDTEEKENILGETSFQVKSYKPSSSVETYYARKGSTLWEKLKAIVDKRSKGSELKTTVVDVMFAVDDKDNVTVEDGHSGRRNS